MAKAAKRRPEYDSELFARGLEVRRAVLGADYVDNSIASADDFMVAFQKLVTEYCWGEIWTRPKLDRKQRSMLNLAMPGPRSTSRPELRLHLRGAPHQRGQPGGDQRDPAASLHLLRHSLRPRSLQDRRRGVQGSR